MTNTNRERQNFEGWVQSGNGGVPAAEILKRLPNGDYLHQNVHAAWRAWQARADFIE